jgi:K+-sensing histidine kinase KdpD
LWIPRARAILETERISRLRPSQIGAGMSAEEIARALDTEAPPRPERKEAGGLGIGLPLASSLAKANGARIEIDSTPGDGTVVALVFPKDRVAAQRALPPPRKTSDESSN